MAEKLSFKQTEIPLSKFNDVAIPHHLELLQKHKHNIKMYQKQHEWDRVRIEQNNASRLIKQLKQLLYEMDVLRNRVQECDLEKFDRYTNKSRQTVQNVITDYLVLVSKVSTISIQIPTEEENTSDFQSESKMMGPLIINDMEYEKDAINEKEACLRSAKQLQRDLEDLHETFFQLQQIITEQGELVNKIEDNVEIAHENVHEGAFQIAKAARYKKAMYPLTGAAIGTCIGGPIGFVAGLKLGSLAAIGCGITGYFGGKLLKEHIDEPPYKNGQTQSEQIDKNNPTIVKQNRIL